MFKNNRDEDDEELYKNSDRTEDSKEESKEESREYINEISSDSVFVESVED